MGTLFSAPLVVKAAEILVESAKDMLCQKFSTVQISKTEVDKAQRIMQANVSSWEESMVHDLTSGVDPNCLDEFAELLLESLQLTNENHKIKIKSTIKIMKFAKTKESDVLEVSFNVDKYRSVYGFLAAVKAKDDTITFAYAFHSLTFQAELQKEKF